MPSTGRGLLLVALIISELDRSLPDFRQIPDRCGYHHDLPITYVLTRSNFAETLDNFVDNLQTRGHCLVPIRVRRKLPVEP